MTKCDFNKNAEQQLCWNHASQGGVRLSVGIFWTPYHGMVTEGLILVHHTIHCIVNVSVCIKGADDKTIVFCRSLQILT